MLVHVGKTPGRVDQVSLNTGATVADALSANDLDATGYTINLNSEVVNTSHLVHDGDRVLLTKEIKGNS